MEYSFGWFVILFLGLFGILKFKTLGKFFHEQAEGVPSVLPKKWDIVFMQIIVLIVCSVFLTISLVKLVNIYF